MADAYLLDTNAAIAILNGDTAIEQVLNTNPETYVPIMVLGELYFGAEKSARRTANLQRVEDFASKRKIIDCDHETARLYGQIMQQLAAKGRMIPPNDIWIAAVAKQYDLVILTNDRHFDEINSITSKNW